jgi:hypothetical protein
MTSKSDYTQSKSCCGFVRFASLVFMAQIFTIVNWLDYVICPLALLFMVSHFLKSHLQVYEQGLGYVNK